MAALSLLALLVAVALIGVAGLAARTALVGRAFSRLALRAFGGYVADRRPSDEPGAGAARLRNLRGAHLGVTYRVYAARTHLYAAVAAVAGSLLAPYTVWVAFALLGVSPETVRAALPASTGFVAEWLAVPSLTFGELFALLLASSATVGVATGLGVYRVRWWWPGYLARERARRIDASMARTVAFVYALSRSGMTVPKALGILARNRGVYGEAAREFGVAVRDMDALNADAVEALRRLSRRSASREFREFNENFVSALQGGRKLPVFLRDQYEYYREEAAARQERTLELLATLAEGYVTGLVAGPLFLVTVLVIIGLVFGGTLPFLRLLVYVLVPTATVAFVVYLDSLSLSMALDPEGGFGGATWRITGVRRAEGATGETVAADGGALPADPDPGETRRNAGRLAAAKRLRRVRRRLADSGGLAASNPDSLLWLTVPVAGAYLLLSAWPVVAADAGTIALGPWTVATGGGPLRLLDDVAVQATLFVVGTYAVAYELDRRRTRAIEAAIPDFLDRLASVTEAGMPLTDGFGRVVDSDLGALDDELERAWADVQWGARLESALRRFERRVDSATVTRTVALVTNAMHATGDVAPVLRIAAREAQATRRLERERRQEALTYVVVIYLSFLVFLVIVGALDRIFLPSMPTAEAIGDRFTGGVGIVTGSGRAAYSLLFFHAALVQAVCSGAVAGLMSEGDLRAGAKHATVMLAFAYALFLLLA